jgi:hypothetical protein
VQKAGDELWLGRFRSLLVSTNFLHALAIKSEMGGDNEKALCSKRFSAAVCFLGAR